jgi:hypothetical protein
MWLCVLPLILALSALVAGGSLPPILANQNHASAGTLLDGVLTVHLEITKGEWHPETDDGIALNVYAFGESAKPLQKPWPADPGTTGHGHPGIVALQAPDRNHCTWLRRSQRR